MATAAHHVAELFVLLDVLAGETYLTTTRNALVLLCETRHGRTLTGQQGTTVVHTAAHRRLRDGRRADLLADRHRYLLLHPLAVVVQVRRQGRASRCRCRLCIHVDRLAASSLSRVTLLSILPIAPFRIRRVRPVSAPVSSMLTATAVSRALLAAVSAVSRGVLLLLLLLLAFTLPLWPRSSIASRCVQLLLYPVLPLPRDAPSSALEARRRQRRRPPCPPAICAGLLFRRRCPWPCTVRARW
mmetsp:Transcript_17592/g.52674  ORF Transcript_17592/g.52674 Transcript_17592/m.52674 type:complete len:243 (-) Transcript_17592:1047-1775(-)